MVIDNGRGWRGASGEYFATPEDARRSFPWAAKCLSKQLATEYHWKKPLDSGTRRKLRIFLYHTQEDKPLVRKLYERLKLAGAEPWVEDNDVFPETLLKPATETMIEQADVILVCLSNHAVNKGRIRIEIARALDKAESQPIGTVFLIALRLESCILPVRLSNLQCIDYYAMEGYERLMLCLWARADYLEILPPRNPITSQENRSLADCQQ